MGKTYTNSGKSVKERLLNLSRAENYNPQMRRGGHLVG